MPMLIPAAMVAGSVISSEAGKQASEDQTAAATAARQQAVAQWLALNVPDPQEQAVELQNYAVTGTLSPTLETAMQQSQSGLSNLSFDQSGHDAQLAALGQLENLSHNGGLDAQSEQQLTQATNQANANERGQRGAIVQNAAARGMGQGGGAMLAAELQASQGDANQAAAGGQSAAAAAQMRALQAMEASGTLGGQVNSQQYAQAAAAAQAQDVINRFNAQNSQSVAHTNVTNQNAANAANLANQQSIANANTGVANQQEVANKGLIQQQFNNQTTKAAGASGQYAGVAQQANQNATNTANMWSGIGQAATQGIGAYGQYANSQANLDAYNKRTDALSGTSSDTTMPDSADPTSASFNGPPAPTSYARGGEVKKSSPIDLLYAEIQRRKALGAV